MIVINQKHFEIFILPPLSVLKKGNPSPTFSRTLYANILCRAIHPTLIGSRSVTSEKFKVLQTKKNPEKNGKTIFFRRLMRQLPVRRLSRQMKFTFLNISFLCLFAEKKNMFFAKYQKD